MVCYHRVSSPCECRRVVRSKSLEVTRTSLTTCYISLCYSYRCNTYSLSKSLLIKHWWCLTSTSWTPSTSSSSTSHLHSLNDKFNLNTVSPRHKHSPETLLIHINQCIHIVFAFSGNARQLILYLKYCFQQKFIFENFIFENFTFAKILSNASLKFTEVSLRHKHSLEILFTHRKKKISHTMSMHL